MLLATTREKPRRGGERARVDGVARAGDRAAAQRERVGFVGRGIQPRVVAPQRGRVRQEEVRDQHRLGASQVRIRRHQRVAGRLRAIGAGGDQCRDRALQQRNPASAGTAADPATPARCATGRCAAGGRRRRCDRPAAAPRSCARPRPGPATNAGSRCPRSRIASKRALDRGGVVLGQHAGADRAPRPRPGCRSRRPGTAPDRSRTRCRSRTRRDRAPCRSGQTTGSRAVHHRYRILGWPCGPAHGVSGSAGPAV